MLGRTQEAIPLLERRTGVEGDTHLAVGYLQAGRVGDALAAARRAVTAAMDRGAKGFEADARRILADVICGGDPADMSEADEQYQSALAQGESLGMRPLVAHCHLGLGKMYRDMSKRQKAQHHLTTALTMYREMDTPFWLKKAEAEMRPLE